MKYGKYSLARFANFVDIFVLRGGKSYYFRCNFSTFPRVIDCTLIKAVFH